MKEEDLYLEKKRRKNKIKYSYKLTVLSMKADMLAGVWSTHIYVVLTKHPRRMKYRSI